MGVASTFWRKAWAALAVIVALNLAYQAGPGHADSQDLSVAGAHAGLTLENHHPGDGDAGHHGQAAGHCAGHCGGHVAKDTPPTEVVVAFRRAPIIYAGMPERRPESAIPQPLIRPPSA